MAYRYVIFEEWLGPIIFKFPAHQTARLRNEYLDRNPQIFETLSDARVAALAMIDGEVQSITRRLGDFSGASVRSQTERRRELTALTEDKVELFNL